MGLARLFNRDVQYTATDTKTGARQTFTIVDDIAPDWSRGEYRGGMGLPGAWRCALLMSDLLGSVPWHAYRERAGAPPERIVPTPPILDQPAPPDPRVTTFSSMVLDLIWHGNAIALIAGRNREGWPVAYLPVKAEDVQVKRVESYDGIALPLGTIAYRVGSTWYPAEEVLHVKGPCRPGALRGMGVLENHLNGVLGLAEEQGRQARAVGNAGVPTGTLTVEDTPEDPLTPEEAAEVKAGWMRSQRERSVAVLNARTKFDALAWNPTETQLLEARKFSLHETALIFGLDPSWLGVSGSSMTYQNVELKGLELVKYSLTGHLSRLEQTLTLHLPRGTWAKANLDAILRADTKTRYEAHEIGIRAGFLTDDEARALEDRPPLTPAQREAQKPPVPRPAEPGPEEDQTDQETT
ncbi:phage portal protein [Pseudonocardia sp. NPDC049154]|uniref:phage portal protein n=1 Tax=Pseudonocardia sp. NPDC049154 TaxID=3155501 RepID=UPI00340E10A1